MVMEAAVPHPPVPPARLARGGPMCVAQGLHGESLPQPPRPRPLRRQWQRWLVVTAAGRLWHSAVRRRCIRACITCWLHLCGLLGGKGGEGRGGTGTRASPIVLPTPPPPPLLPLGAVELGGSRAVPGTPLARAISR